jgi:ribosomal protein S18 acetylase RimI-like enzyme
VGNGTQVLRRVLAEAGAAGQTVRLGVMKQDSALAFYRKLGFTVIVETQTHLFMKRTAQIG